MKLLMLIEIFMIEWIKWFINEMKFVGDMCSIEEIVMRY